MKIDFSEICPLSRTGRYEKFHLNESIASRFHKEATLVGSQLCVNRLAWNSTGTLLLSGSDDRKLCLFSFPDHHRPPLSISSLHEGNIFGVQFLPFTNDQILVSGAMDGAVIAHRLESPAASQLQRQPTNLPPVPESDENETPRCVEAQVESSIICIHGGRVKDVEVDEATPFVLWSVSEDGTIRQTDLRDIELVTGATATSRNVLIGVSKQNGHGTIELKGMDINKERPYQLAVACGDAYVRVYDRRKLSIGVMDSTFPEPLMMLAPPHMTLYGESHTCNTTYVNFSNRGDKLACLYHLDHCYTFDITSEGTAACTYYRPSIYPPLNSSNGHFPITSPKKIPRTSSTSKKAIDSETELDFWSLSKAIKEAPENVSNYLARGRCLLNRGIHGSSCFALRDFDQAIALDPGCKEANLLRCEALHYSNMSISADHLMKKFLEMHPEEADSEEVAKIKKKIREGIKRKEESSRGRESSHDDDESSFTYSTEEERSRRNATEVQTDDWFKYYCIESDNERQKSRGGRPDGIWWITQGGRRLLNQYVGQLNNKTDIKECSFVGQNDALIACGSDDGNVYIYNTDTGRPVNLLEADAHVVNCVQSHPSVACLATSGIESTVKLWSPGPEYVEQEKIDAGVQKNYDRLVVGPVSSSTLFRLHNLFDEIRRAWHVDHPNEEVDDEGNMESCRVA